MPSQSLVTTTANSLLPAKIPTLEHEQNYCAPKAWIEFLPAEILLIIFKLVFMKSRAGTFRLRPPCSCADPRTQGPCDCHAKPFTTVWVEKEDRQNPHIFPYATSLVCSRWRSLMKTVPIFWTRVIVFVDAHPTPLARLRAHLQLSGGLPLDLYVLRRSGTYDQPDPEEHVRCAAVIDVLRPYFRRCRVISFDVIHNSSLPSITREMYGWAHHLVNLELKCRLDDGQQYVSRPDRRRHNTKPFTFPILENLHVDGRNFADACVYLPSWRDTLSRPRTLDVTIANFQPVLHGVDHPCRARDVADVLSHMYDIRVLSLENLEFPEANLQNWDVDPVYIAATNLDLTDIPKAFLDAFLQLTQVSLFSLSVVRSPLPRSGDAFDAVETTLEEIPPSEDIPAFLQLWRGLDLEVVGCEGFDDRAVQALGVGHPASTANVIDERRHFAIRDCPGVSPAALRELIKVRCEANTGGQGDKCTLAVTGRGAILPDDDRAWFEENLQALLWETDQAA